MMILSSRVGKTSYSLVGFMVHDRSMIIALLRGNRFCRPHQQEDD